MLRLPLLRLPVFGRSYLAAALLALALAAAFGAAHLAADVPNQGRTERPAQGLKVLRVTLGPEGFTPAEVTLPRGRFLLVVYNKSGLEDVVLRLDGENGGRLREARSKGRGSRWRDVFDPPPGRYVLGVADRPAWKCDITVAAR